MRSAELRTYTGLVAACALAWAALGGFLAGPTVEATFRPVNIAQRVERTARERDRLCWDWTRVKVRDEATDDLDVFLYVNGERSVVALFGAADGQPWRRAAAVTLGPAYKRYCVMLPPGTPERASLRLEQTLYYRGLWGLWRVPLHVPDVVYPPPEVG